MPDRVPRKSIKKCTCGEPSLRGLTGKNPPCAYQWAAVNWGKSWADRNYPTHPHRRKEKKNAN